MFRYRCIYLPTGEHWDIDLPVIVAELYSVDSVESFHRLLIRWNGMDKDRWAYAPIE